MGKNKIYKLKNNLTVIICDYPNFNSVYFDLAIRVGSRYESKKNNGISHLAEHVVTKKVIQNLQKYSWIKNYIDQTFQAYILTDRTNFEFSSHKQDLELSIKVLSKIFLIRNISKKDIEIEKKIILEELFEKRAEHDFNYNQKVRKIYYPENPLQFEIIGTKNNIKNFNMKDVKDFIKKYYRPENTILTIAGNVNHKDVIKLIDCYFEFNNKSIKILDNFQKYIYQGDVFHIIDNKTQQDYFSYYCPIFDLNVNKSIKWEFFVEILNNYLFQIITNKLFCYSFNVGITTYIDFSNFSIESSFDPKKTTTFYLLLQKLLNNFLKTLDVKKLEYLKKEKMKSIDLDKDYPRESANMAGWNALVFENENIITLDYQQKVIKSIKIKDIQTYFNYVFKNNKGTVIIGADMSKAKKQQLESIWHNWKI